MKLHRLRVEGFGSIRAADIALGPGLNVLHGPNDLGKSTLAAAMRLVLLLPHSSTHGAPYVPWVGGQKPMVELTFETEAQRIWRVRKQFGKGTTGSSLLQESKDGVDFDDRAKGRQVDAELRRLLDWGIPEPGGTGAGKGLPHSFLATVLLSTQGEVGNLLAADLAGDALSTGKDRLAAALQAVAQDPLFVKVLGAVQERRDEAFTDRGARKTARGTVFKVASDRLADARKAKNELEKQVSDSAAVEAAFAALVDRRQAAQQAHAAAAEQVEALGVLVRQAADRATADRAVADTKARVDAIRQLAADQGAAAQRVLALAAALPAAEGAVKAAEAEQTRAEQARASLEAVEGADPALAENLERQQLELQRAEADQQAAAAHQQRVALDAAHRGGLEATRAAEAAAAQVAAADAAALAAGAADEAVANVRAAADRDELLERALDARDAQADLAALRVEQAEARALAEALGAARAELDALKRQRAEIGVPPDLAPLRKLHTDLAAARGALSVGLVVTVTPSGPVDLGVARDGRPSEVQPITGAIEVEADAELQLGIGAVATVRIRGGRRSAQARVTDLEARWQQEAVPALVAAGVTDLEGLDRRRTEAGELDLRIREAGAAVAAQEHRLGAFEGLSDRIALAEQRSSAATLAVGAPLEPLAGELVGLTRDTLKRRRAAASRALDTARTAAERARQTAVLARQKADQLAAAAADAATRSADALRPFAGGPERASTEVTAALEAAERRSRDAGARLDTLAAAQETRRQQSDRRTRDAAEAVEAAKATVRRSRDALSALVGDLRFAEAERDRLVAAVAASDLAGAERALMEATARHGALPIPARAVPEAELTEAERRCAQALARLGDLERELQLTRGRLMQVGGAVAKERLAAAVEAYELAERDERALEVEYDAWRLLLDQLKEADAAQASNLGQALAPTLSSGFARVTRNRYDRVQLTASMATEGVVVGGAVRQTASLSLGTREQLSTLYRLALAECLGSALVLDDQLVQSDGTRMAWFREVLRDKAKAFQIVVLTCRPEDYLTGDDDSVRAIDLATCLRRV